MILAIDNMAAKYHCLPSKVLATGTTFDLRVCEIATMWHNRQNEQATTGRVPVARPNEQQMMEMLAKVRNP